MTTKKEILYILLYIFYILYIIYKFYILYTHVPLRNIAALIKNNKMIIHFSERMIIRF